MLRSFATAIFVFCFPISSFAQSQPAPATTAPAAKPAAKKAVPKAKSAAKQAPVESGPCRLGVISALGDHFAVQKFGLTIFETEESAVTTEGWGLDDLVVARIRAATGTDPGVRRIAYPKGAFEPFYHPTSRFLPDPREGLPAIVRSITSAANCERYLVVTRFKGQVPGTKLTLDGIGAYSQGLGSLVRHSHLFANVGLTLLDGGNYETISRPFAGFGTRMAESLRLTEDPLTKLDNAQFPEPPTTVPGNAMLRERTRALVAARLDQVLPSYLKNE